ncbi:alanine racemase [Staphylococcus carnosus]|nr:alanine racemase [Staphylococcus carnosus]POA00246.1 alanine racemase [Staphylococcus carnosus]QQS84698.1 alanine racemase [Staphylococcus carnosus]QRQ04637.1 alanine racemase [Staphylococcus carnosus]GEP80668.1 alanine racemase [Staphylococcus carnosus]
MMAYLEIDLAKIQHNTLMLKHKLEQRGLDITPVIKCIAGDRTIVEALKQLGIHHVGDARFSNMDKLDDEDLSFMMIRTPNRRELKETVLKVSISIQTEIETIRRINEIAASLDKKHKILLMVDWKDSREGILTYDIPEYINEIMHMKYICLAGLAFNFMCFQDIAPTEEDILLINQFIQSVEKKTGYPLKMISGGNSSALPLLDYCTFGRINDLRIGESLFRGVNTVDQQPIHYLFQDAITLKAEIIEIKPRIDTVKDASYLQVILDIGQIDTAIKDIFPMYDNVRIMGATSDHLMVDLKNSDFHKVGDMITFKLGYQALAHSMYQDTIPHEYVREPGVQMLVDTFQTSNEKIKIK